MSASGHIQVEDDDGSDDLLNAFRYLCRGTRRRPGSELIIGGRVASLVSVDGVQLSVARWRPVLVDAVRHAGLSSVESLALSEFYGLAGFPSDLTGRRGLVGRVPLFGPYERSAASRSTVRDLVAVATSKALGQLPACELGPAMTVVPESDPAVREWVTRPETSDGPLDRTQLNRLFDAALVAAFDWVDLATSARQIQAALHAWGQRHGVRSALSSPEIAYRQEHRNAANAALAFSLFTITHDSELLMSVVEGSPSAVWLRLPDVDPTIGRMAELGSDVVTSGLNTDELVLLVGRVFERDDETAEAADLVMEIFRSGRHQTLVDSDMAETLVWAFGRGLASTASWRTLELTRWHVSSRRVPNWTSVTLLAWSAHVASLHLHDTLAWRLTSLCERMVADVDPDGLEARKRALVSFQVELIRSGCRLREADRWLDQNRPAKSVALIEEAQVRLVLARDAFRVVHGKDVNPVVGMSIGIRVIEILFLAGLCRAQGHPVPGFAGEFDQVRSLLDRARLVLVVNERDADDDDDILAERLDRLELALATEPAARLDDSPLDPIE